MKWLYERVNHVINNFLLMTAQALIVMDDKTQLPIVIKTLSNDNKFQSSQTNFLHVKQWCNYRY